MLGNGVFERTSVIIINQPSVPPGTPGDPGGRFLELSGLLRCVTESATPEALSEESTSETDIISLAYCWRSRASHPCQGKHVRLASSS